MKLLLFNHDISRKLFIVALGEENGQVGYREGGEIEAGSHNGIKSEPFVYM